VIEVGGNEEQVVVTKCGHYFHKACICSWVNDSGMETANTCPSCRFVLCERRERVHPSSEEQVEEEAEEAEETEETEESEEEEGEYDHFASWDSVMLPTDPELV
jgi:hypothetical protein